jgi:hypothetical protein
MWAYKYLAGHYTGIGAPSMSYCGDTTAGDTVQNWACSSDWGYAGWNTLLWGAQMHVNPDLQKAGVQVCVEQHLSWTGWVGYVDCNDMLHYYPDPLTTEALRFVISHPLPDAYGNRQQLCGQATSLNSNGSAGYTWGCTSTAQEDTLIIGTPNVYSRMRAFGLLILTP